MAAVASAFTTVSYFLTHVVLHSAVYAICLSVYCSRIIYSGTCCHLRCVL